MDKVLKMFPARSWSLVQGITLGIVGLVMLLVLEQSHWSPGAAILLIISARSCWSVYRSTQRQSQRATTDAERLQANWQLLELAMAVIAVLSLCIFFLRTR